MDPQNKNQAIVPAPTSRNWRRYRQVLVAILIILGLALAAWGVKYWLDERSQEAMLPCAQDNPDSLLPSAVAALDLTQPDKIPELGGVVGQIETHPNYEQDPTCLYAVVWYYILTTQIEEAKDNYAKLESVHEGDADFAAYRNPSTLSEINDEIDFLATLREEASDPTLGSSPPEN